jgi:tRNA pseudouridine55 synthase
MDGLILVDKEINLSSHDIISKLRNIFHIRKIGHFGTLDPMATGLMLVAIERATKLSPFLSKLNKVYLASIQLGYSTDTYDVTGNPSFQINPNYPSEKNLFGALAKMEGDLLQVPPPFSAKKYKGKPLYSFARKNIEINLPPCKIFIHYIDLLSYKPPMIDVEIKCSSGTYIRSIAHDLGQSLGCGAHLFNLKRTEVGPYKLSNSFSLEQIKILLHENKFIKFITPLEQLLPQFPKLILNETGTTMAKNGNFIFPENILKITSSETIINSASENKENIFRLFSPEGKLIALAKRCEKGKGLHPFLVIDNT